MKKRVEKVATENVIEAKIFKRKSEESRGCGSVETTKPSYARFWGGNREE